MYVILGSKFLVQQVVLARPHRSGAGPLEHCHGDGMGPRGDASILKFSSLSGVCSYSPGQHVYHQNFGQGPALA
ncbi:hypothetical protein PAPYR_8387 [Paratrimastix pyriformis]|uniref:Uncharacterized protein n=1 Tax=Paratrimastix pyriformis TaxID=342808 RepID=A0ABQ8UAU3_9EUKA|nr:hypothetical protein PAPYR_8387 [Paratrimastix pyriformis]